MLTRQQVRDLKKGDYKVVTRVKDKKQFLVPVQPEVKQKKVQGDIEALIIEHQLITEKKSKLSHERRDLICLRITEVARAIESKSFYHRYIWPVDGNGELIRYLSGIR